MHFQRMCLDGNYNIYILHFWAIPHFRSYIYLTLENNTAK